MGTLQNETFSNWYKMLGSDTIKFKINGFKTINLLDKIGNNHPVKLQNSDIKKYPSVLHQRYNVRLTLATSRH